MATLYFNAAVDNNWSELDNWWQDGMFSVPATSLPGLYDDAIIWATCSSNSGSAASVNSLEINNSGMLGTTFSIACDIATTCTVNGGSQLTGNITGGSVILDASSASNCTLDDGVGNAGHIIRNGGSAAICTFNGNLTIGQNIDTATSSISGNTTVNGNVILNSNGQIGILNGTHTINGNLTINGTGTVNAGTLVTDITGNVTLSATASSSNTVNTISGDLIYAYGSTATISYSTLGGSTLYAGYPTLYYYNYSASTDWNTLSNWYVDNGYNQLAASIPDSTQDVVLNSDITSDSSAGAVANNITVNTNVELWISVTVTTLTIFNTGSYYGDGTNSITLTSPTVTFNGDSYLATGASIVGDVNFYDTSANNGSITGNVTVYYAHAVPFNSSNGNNGTISGTISYSGYSSRTVYFYHTSSSEDWTNINYWYNGSGGTGGNVYVPDSAISLDDVIIEATPLDNTSTNRIVKTLTVNQNPTNSVNPYIYNDMVITCDYATFNDATSNEGSITQSSNHSSNKITFNDLSFNSTTGTIEPYSNDNIPVVFNDGSSNDGTIDGDAVVYYPSEKPIGGTVNGTVTYIGYTLYFTDGGGGNNGDWSTSTNWFLDVGGSNGYNDFPSEIIPYQDVVIISNLTSYSGAGVPVANNLSTYGSYPYISNINITIDGLATFSEETYLDSTATITGNALFEDLATNRGGSITGTATFTLSAAESMISNGYDGTYGNIEFQYGKGVNGSSILGIV